MEVGGIIDIGLKTKIWLRHWDKACKLCELIHMDEMIDLSDKLKLWRGLHFTFL